MNEDAFGVPSNEPYLYLRSAYLDYRFNAPKTWILVVAGKNLDVKTAQCIYSRDKGKTETVNATLSHNSGARGCFYRQYIFDCNLGERNPHFVTLTFNGKGKFYFILTIEIMVWVTGIVQQCVTNIKERITNPHSQQTTQIYFV